MPNSRSRAYAKCAAIAAFLLVPLLLSGCGTAAPPVGNSAFQPDPFAPGLPTPTNTTVPPGGPTTVRVTQVAVATPTLVAATPAAGAATPAAMATLTVPAVPPTSTPTGQGDPSRPTAVTPTPSAVAVTAAPTETPIAGITSSLPIDPTAPTGTATDIPEDATDATPTPTGTLVSGTPTAEQTPTLTRVVTVIPADTPTPLPSATAAPTRTPTSSPVPSPTPTGPATVDWNLTRDVVGLWEYVEDDWRYYFDFFSDGRVVISENGIHAYQILDERTLSIQMMEDEWRITVLDLTPDYLVLEGVIGENEQFGWIQGTPGLASQIVGLWLDDTSQYPSIDFAPNGIVVGEFGRGTYQVASDNTVLITCDVTENCSIYLDYGQADDAPLPLRIYGIADNQMSLQGFGYGQPWTLPRQEGQANLGADLIGRWVDDFGDSVEFTANGEWIVNDEFYGQYEVLSSSTVWTELEGAGSALVVTELTANELTYAEWGIFFEQDLWTYERDGSQ